MVESLPELGITVCAHGAAFSGARLDIGTRYLLTFLDRMPASKQVVDLGCGTGILASMYALRHPDARVVATDQSAAAVASARATAAANGLGGERVAVIHDDAMSTLEPGSVDLILLNPPFHLGASVHAGAALKMFQAAARVLAPPGGRIMDCLQQPFAVPGRPGTEHRANGGGRPESEVHCDSKPEVLSLAIKGLPDRRWHGTQWHRYQALTPASACARIRSGGGIVRFRQRPSSTKFIPMTRGISD